MSFTNVKNLTTFGGNLVKISCAVRDIGDRTIWSFSEIRLLSFPSIFENSNQSCERRERGGGCEEGGGGYVKRFYINVSFNTRMHTSHRNVNQV